MNRSPSMLEAQRRMFLQRLSETGNVTDAAGHSGLNRCALYRARANNRAFGMAWEKAVELGTAALEDEAVRRAAEGWLDPVFYQGKECGRVRRYSDGLLMFLLKARRPEAFKDRTAVEHQGELTLERVLAEIDGTTRGLPSQRPEASRQKTDDG